MKTLSAFCLAVVLTGCAAPEENRFTATPRTPGHFKPVYVEITASLIGITRDDAQSFGEYIRAVGYRCDSVAAAHFLWLYHDDMVLICDRGARRYEIGQDKSGVFRVYLDHKQSPPWWPML